jgi:DNA modification methylase
MDNAAYNEFLRAKMNPYWQDNHRTLYNHDCRLMPELPDESVQMVVTSPPYWGLRKYAGEQTIDDWGCAYGLEPTPELYVRHTIEILREIKRVLRKDGVVFWNIADSYAGSGKGLNADGKDGGSGKKQLTNAGSIDVVSSKRIPRGSGRWNDSDIPASGVLKPKDLCLIPFRVAIAAQEDGWWVRSDIIWSKNNPMPESVRDRPTNSHEYILMFTKSKDYYWDQEAVREEQTGNAHPRGDETCNDSYQKARGSFKDFKSPITKLPAGRNLRSVWTFPTQPYPAAHFATFPEELPERCIKAATPEAGCCSKCGKPWERLVEKTKAVPASWHGSYFDDGKNLEVHPNVGRREDAHTNGGKVDNTKRLALMRQQARENGGEYVNETKTIGWQPACKCNAPAIPSTVLEPFAGSGTTLYVAARLGRKSVGYELSGEYCRLIVQRNKQHVLV